MPISGDAYVRHATFFRNGETFMPKCRWAGHTQNTVNVRRLDRYLGRLSGANNKIKDLKYLLYSRQCLLHVNDVRPRSSVTRLKYASHPRRLVLSCTSASQASLTRTCPIPLSLPRQALSTNSHETDSNNTNNSTATSIRMVSLLRHRRSTCLPRTCLEAVDHSLEYQYEHLA